MTSLLAFDRLSGGSNRAVTVEMSQHQVETLGNRHSHCQRPEHQALCGRLKHTETEGKHM